MDNAYILKGKTPVKCTIEEWVSFMETKEGQKAVIVGKTQINEDIEVSTVFLGLDHSFNQSDKPKIFETMVFGGEQDECQWRHSTWNEAELFHHNKVRELRR